MLYITFNAYQFQYTWVIVSFLDLNMLPFLGTRTRHALIITTTTVIRKQTLLTARGIQRISHAPGNTATSVFMKLALLLTNCQV